MIHSTLASRRLALRPVALAVALIAAGGSALAQTQAQAQAVAPAAVAEASLPSVTVSASGLQLGAGEMTTPVTVLEGDELVRRREATLGETLSSEPGITSSHFGAGASRPIIRGMDGPRVRVLSDGAELHDASTISPDHAVVSEPMLATQIEVLRGPSALVYGNGAVGGVVNVLDGKVPTAIPQKGYEGSAELRANTGAREGAGALSLTGGAGNLAVHVEGVARDAGDYRVGKGWAPEGEATRKVPGSFNRTDTGSVGLSWVGERGYLGAAYTRQTAKYGLPGHNHSFEGCHTHGNHLHCGAHAGEDDDHDHEDHDHGDVPVVDLRSERFDVRGELRNPFAGFSALRLRAGVTDYVHDEVEDGAVSTTFKNKAYDTRVELQHEPIAGFKGVVGLQTSQRKFSAEGEEAYVEPTVTRKVGLFVLEEYRLGDWRFEGALRHDRQTAEAQTTGIERSHNGTSASLGAVWRFTPGYQVGTSFTRRHFLRLASDALASMPMGSRHGLALIDLDHFKRINDAHGHAVGDRVLLAFAQVASEHLCDAAVLARYGGEEFVLLLPDCTAQALEHCCERLRQAFGALPSAAMQGQVGPLSLSVGMTLLTAEDDLDNALHRADQALYRAKRSGRNRCVPAWEVVDA